MNFQYNLPVNLLFGSGRINSLGTETAKYGKRACIVTGTGSTKKSGLLDRAVDLLKAAQVESFIFDKVTPNPLTTTALEAAAFVQENGCDVVIGLGGGSIMDAAKATAFLCKNTGDINDYIFGKIQGQDALPIILVPTTCGTGSEGNGFAVLTNPETGDKKSLRGNFIVAKASIIDPDLMKTMPKSVLASVGFDALCHSMEAYISNIGQPLTRIMSLDSIALSANNLVKAYQGSDEADVWDSITWASTLGGMVINTAGVALPHGMEHPASGLKDIVHGRGLAALTPVIYELSIDSAPEKFAEISKLLGGKDAYDCVDRIYKLLDDIDLHISLGELGITSEDIPWMTENCLKVAAANIQNHPRLVNAEDIATLYQKAL